MAEYLLKGQGRSIPWLIYLLKGLRRAIPWLTYLLKGPSC
jgi:hypothetical protein